MKIANTNKNTIIAEDCKVADIFYFRFMGLMGKDELKPGTGLHIVPCNSIHMFFMKFPLDIVFLSRDNTVVHIIEGIKPWRLSKIVNSAHSVLELPVGAIKASKTQPGDRLEFIF